MKTEQLQGAEGVHRAVALLGEGKVVSLPTETVYGLAADALRPEAVVKIFEAKDRPRFDPLIIHLPDQTWLERLAHVSTENKEILEELIRRFWPGPLTIILPKLDVVPGIVTAGLDTVALRLSAHPVFGEIIRNFGKPLAAPSANRFGRVSPTTPGHVMAELGGRIPLVVDGGPTSHGIESTIVAIRNGAPEILRPGPITADQLGGIGGPPMSHRPAADATTPQIRAPGQLPSHYAPTTPFRIVGNINSFWAAANERIGTLTWTAMKNPARFAATRQLSAKQDLREAAANLFRYLRELDDSNLDLIVAELVPEHGLGAAINDRLRKAEGRGRVVATNQAEENRP
ncbi:MAG: L-threonylcarbamoyladenylate synthase [Chthoniobacterales bacterium]